MRHRLVLIGVMLVLVLGAIGVAGCGSSGSSTKPATGPVCSYDSDDAGCPAVVNGPDNDGNR